MSSDAQPGDTARVKKTVRFSVSETTREILEKSTWRKPLPPQQSNQKLSPKGQKGKAIIKFAISKMLFTRLPTTRRPALEAYCSRLLSVEQLAAWWSSLPASYQAWVDRFPRCSTVERASGFCEVIVEIYERKGNPTVTGTIAPLVISVLALWEVSKEIADVKDTNTAAEIAAKGKKAGNALGDARSRCYAEYEKRKRQYEVLRHPDPDLARIKRLSRFETSWRAFDSGNMHQFTIEFKAKIISEQETGKKVLGTGLAPQLVVARELAAEQALANWHICEATLKEE